MLNEAVLDGFYNFFPAINWKKVWGFLKVQDQPVRPEENIPRFYYVTIGDAGAHPIHPDDLAIGDTVYIDPKNKKAIYWDYKDDPDASNARYLKKSLDDLLKESSSCFLSLESIKDKGDTISPDDRQRVLVAYYGETKAKALLAATPK